MSYESGTIYQTSDKITVQSGAEIDFESGSALKIAGTDATTRLASVTALTTAEVELSDASIQTETVSGAGAISVTKRITKIDSTAGTFAATLAAPDATMLGQVKVIEMTVDNGDVTIALTNVQGGTAATTATFDAVGETLTLVGGTTKWNVVGESGVTLS